VDTRIEIFLLCDADRRVKNADIFKLYTYTVADFIRMYEEWMK
jgi:hypothetical protein